MCMGTGRSFGRHLQPSFVKSSSTAHLLEVLVVKLLVSFIVIVQLWPAVFCVILAIAFQSLK